MRRIKPWQRAAQARKHCYRGFSALALAIAVAGCSDSRQPENLPQPEAEQPPVSAEPTLAAAQQLALSTRQALCTATSLLESQVAELVESPSRVGLDEARRAWVSAHESWRLWQRLLLIAAAGAPPAAHALVDATPILPGYLDSVPGYPVSGLVHSDVPLDPQFLAETHQSTDLYYGVLGFHPLEFMLWGIPGESGDPGRKASEFEPEKSAESETLPAKDRRRTLTLSIAGLLQLSVEDHCAPTKPLPELEKLRMLTGPDSSGTDEPDQDQHRRQLLTAWLEQLAETLAEWEKAWPGAEDRNGMPLWHNAFARTDFAEIRAEWDWLAEHFWPDKEVEGTNTESFVSALDVLADAGPVIPEQSELAAARDSARQLAQALAPSEEGQSEQPRAGHPDS